MSAERKRAAQAELRRLLVSRLVRAWAEEQQAAPRAPAKKEGGSRDKQDKQDKHTAKKKARFRSSRR